MVDLDERIESGSDGDLAAELREERAGELGRLISLSDGVFAFAMTLLIVSVEVPDLTGAATEANLAGDLRALWPQVLSYVIGFLVIGFLWSAHRRTFSRIKDFDETLIRLNIVLLMLVAFLPFPIGVLGEYGNLSLPATLYALCTMGISVIFILILDHLDRHRELMTRGGAGYDFPRAKTRHLVTAAIFLLSIPVSFLIPGAGQLVWILLVFNHHIAERVLPHMPGWFRHDGQS